MFLPYKFFDLKETKMGFLVFEIEITLVPFWLLKNIFGSFGFFLFTV
jgi:hypothetical protein